MDLNNPHVTEFCLSDVCEVISSPVDKKTKDGEIPVRLCNYTDVYYNSVIKNDMKFMIASATESEISKFSLQPGDVVITKDSESPDDIAVPALVDTEVSDLVCGYHLIILRPKKAIYGAYLNHLLSTKDVRRRFFRVANGITRFGLPIGEVKDLKLQLPPIEEQRRIAGILSTWEKAINAYDRLIALKEKQKRGLMQKCLGTGDEISISDLGIILSGGTPKTGKPEYWGGDILWATPTDITKNKNKSISTTERTITQNGLNMSSAKLIPPNSLLICTRATVGEMSINTAPMATNQGFKSIVPHPMFNVHFIYYLLSTMKNDMIRRASGSTFLEISKSQLEAIKVRVPPLDVQNSVAKIISSWDEYINALTQKRDLLKKQKQGLMQQLLA